MNPSTKPQRARARRAPATAILASALLLLDPAGATAATWFDSYVDSGYGGVLVCSDSSQIINGTHNVSRAMGYVRKDGVNAVVFGSTMEDNGGYGRPIGEISRLPNSSVWHYSALSTLAGGPTGMHPMAYVRGDGISTVVYVGDSDSSLHELALVNGKWSHANLSTAANPRGLPSFSTGFWGYVRGDKISTIVYVAADSGMHIHELALVGGHWQDADLSAAAGDLAGASLGDGGLHAYVRADGTSAVVYRGFDGLWRELELYNGKWHVATIGMQAGQTVLGSYPMGYVRADGVNAVVYLGEDKHVYELSQVASRVKGVAWITTDLTAAAGAPNSFGAPWGLVREDHVSAVYYSDELYTHHLHQLSLVNGHWTDTDVNADAGDAQTGSFFTTAFVDANHGTMLTGCSDTSGYGNYLNLARDGLLPP